MIEETAFLSNDDVLWRSVYKYEGTQKEDLIYTNNDSPAQRSLYILDDKGNEIERTKFAEDGSVRSKVSYTYEFDANGNWTKRTASWKVMNDQYQFEPQSVVRTITYY